MKINFVTFIVIIASVHSLHDKIDNFRKHYGLSFHINCKDYVKTFKCMTACKSIGYQVFRMNYRCDCTCHEMKTSTVLPFFKWRTNGTTRGLPKTRSPRLYHIIGTLSPPSKPDAEETTVDTTLPECVFKTSSVAMGTQGTDTSGSPGMGNSTAQEAGGPITATNSAAAKTTAAKA